MAILDVRKAAVDEIQPLRALFLQETNVQAARTSLDNTASRATLLEAGLRVAGFMLIGHVHAPRL